jgi:hypothetical protein
VAEGAAAPALPVTRARASIWRRVREWFWRGSAMAELRAASKVGTRHIEELLCRGWQNLEVAEWALNPTRRLTSGSADAPAWELSRAALHWGLVASHALASTHQGSAEATGGSAGAQSSGESDRSSTLAALLGSADRELLLEAAGGEGEWNSIAAELERTTFASFAELSQAEQARSARRLWTFSNSLLAKLEQPRVRLDRLWLQRIVRSGGAVTLLLVLVAAAVIMGGWLENERNIARGKPWKTSSLFLPTPGCDSPAQDCTSSPAFFFCTQEEEQPWVVIDLKSSQRFSAIRIKNREDCCTERAAPLIVEVSSNERTWKQVARREDVFTNWYQSFAPVSARYVRVRVAKRTHLHLKSISVLR